MGLFDRKFYHERRPRDPLTIREAREASADEELAGGALERGRAVPR